MYPGKDKIDYSDEVKLFVWTLIRCYRNEANLFLFMILFYLEQTVNPKNFLNVLSGNKKAMQGIGSGRVIER